MSIDSLTSTGEKDKTLRFGFSRHLFDEKFEPRIKTLELLKLLGMPSELT